jgi:transcriptional regulator with XRE-family HTH domain
MKPGELNKITGHNIRRLRTMHGYTQEALADRIKAKTSHISEMENGKRGIGEKIIVRLCNIFKIEPYEFYVNNSSPIPLTPLQYKALDVIKEAEELQSDHVVKEVFEFARYRIKLLKKELKTRSSSKRAKRKKKRSS